MFLFWQPTTAEPWDNEQLLDEVEDDSDNHRGQSLCYQPGEGMAFDNFRVKML